MKKFFTVLAALACVAAFKAAPAAAQQQYPGFYAGAFGGANFLQTEKKHCTKYEFDTGYNVGVLLGYKFCGGFRVDAEVCYRYNRLRKIKFGDDSFSFSGSEGDGFDSGSFSSSSSSGRCKKHFYSWSYMANAYYDISIPGCECYSFFPYVGAGVGYSQTRLKSFCNHKKHGFAWQVMAGLAYVIDCNMDVALEYKFHKGPHNRIYDHGLSLVGKYHF